MAALEDMGRPGRCSLCQCAVVGIGLPGSHPAESSTLVIAEIEEPSRLLQVIAWEAVCPGAVQLWSGSGRQAELGSLLKGLPAGRITLLGGWKVPDTPGCPTSGSLGTVC